MFFYDRQLQLYINDEPLLVSGKIQKIAEKIGVALKWDQNGHINQISYHDAKSLSIELGIVMLSVRDFMNLAKREPRVASSNFAEWLDDTYTLLPDMRMAAADGHPLDVPPARPGWFDLSCVGDDGFPSIISSSPGAGKWKFWTQNDPSFKSAAARSFVTSSGTCSLDLGIPSFAQHPNFMIREAYHSQPTTTENPLDSLWMDYEERTLLRDDVEIYDFFKALDIDNLLALNHGLDGFLVSKNQERVADLIGKKRLIEGDFSGLNTINLKTMASALSTKPDMDTVYVTGHEHPDADAVVGAAYEAVRRHLSYGNKCVAWSQRIPFVVRNILGAKLCDILNETPKYEPTNDIVLVDCHSIVDANEYQVKAIIDHHIVSRTFPYYVSISQEVSWSSTIQVYIKFLGSGLDLDRETAKILLEATLIEAEPSLMVKMSQIDRITLQRLRDLAQGGESYPVLMGLLTRDTMRGDPFMMDYKEGLFGFSVIKTHELASFAIQAEANNIKHHLPLTIVKQVVYDPNFQHVVQEQLSMYFNHDFHDKGFRKAILNAVTKACEAMHGKNKVSRKGFEVKVMNVPHQTPRLLLAPLLEGIVKEHLRFFWSKSIGMFVACGFFTDQKGDYGTANQEPTVKTGISFEDVKAVLRASSNTGFMTLPQYWQVFHERDEMNDTIAIKSLRDSKYVELLNTEINRCIEVKHGSQKPTLPSILEAKPALIRIEDINLTSGFPDRLVSPDTYRDSSLWRYWSPDQEENVATRGHIFVMNQTCIDLKIGKDEKTQQLTFRPIYRDIPDLKYNIQSTEDRNWVKVTIFPRLFSVKPLIAHERRFSKLVQGLGKTIGGRVLDSYIQ